MSSKSKLPGTVHRTPGDGAVYRGDDRFKSGQRAAEAPRGTASFEDRANYGYYLQTKDKIRREYGTTPNIWDDGK